LPEIAETGPRGGVHALDLSQDERGEPRQGDRGGRVGGSMLLPPAKGLWYSNAYMYNRSLEMDAITYSAARANLARTMDRVCEDHEPLIITRNGERSVVMLSLEDYQALEETAYLLRSPANASRLLASVAQLAAGKGTPRELVECG
jgi:antitoxin YefM